MKFEFNVGSIYVVNLLRSSLTTGICLELLHRRLRRSNQDLLFSDLPRSLELPRRRSTSYRWIPRVFRWPSPHRWNTRAFWIPALLSTCVSLQVLPRFSSICGIKPRSPASFTLELHYYSFFCVV